ncbi:MAG: hypothetical protein ABF649_05185 [Bacillus sp. (in: firmicutes)]
MQDIFITLNSYEEKMIKENGQQAFVERVKKAGATGIEIRRELVRNENDLVQIAAILKQTTLKIVYSAPVPIWNPKEQLNGQELWEVLQEASILEAKIVKFPLGHFNEQTSKFEEWTSFLQKASDRFVVMVENDQTVYGGNISVIKQFAQKCKGYQLNIPLVFDTGNWQYVNQCFQTALKECKEYVGYLHLKQVVKKEGICVTIPLIDEEGAEWKQAIQTINNVPIAIEFPLKSDEKAKYYVELIRKNCQEEAKL